MFKSHLLYIFKRRQQQRARAALDYIHSIDSCSPYSISGLVAKESLIKPSLWWFLQIHRNKSFIEYLVRLIQERKSAGMEKWTKQFTKVKKKTNKKLPKVHQSSLRSVASYFTENQFCDNTNHREKYGTYQQQWYARISASYSFCKWIFLMA